MLRVMLKIKIIFNLTVKNACYCWGNGVMYKLFNYILSFLSKSCNTLIYITCFLAKYKSTV